MAKIMGDSKEDKDQIIKDLELKNEELTNNWKRALADYQNLEKRINTDREELVKYSSQKIIRDLLSILDTIEKAEAHLKDQGLKLAIENFLAVLKSNGVTKIEVLGKKFDPQTMECIEIVQSEKDDEVVEEIRVGYLLWDKVLRPAQVKVSKNTVSSSPI